MGGGHGYRTVFQVRMRGHENVIAAAGGGSFIGVSLATLPLVTGEVVAPDQGPAPRAGPFLCPVRAGQRWRICPLELVVE